MAIDSTRQDFALQFCSVCNQTYDESHYIRASLRTSFSQRIPILSIENKLVSLSSQLFVSTKTNSIFCLTQEALQKLGFYSGEEDMEYSSFSSGTERAVKTWQVINTPECYPSHYIAELYMLLDDTRSLPGNGRSFRERSDDIGAA